ncbi:MAG: sigma-54 dependent transcriptional regulator [Candidatus Krumholzibacteriia bacterium]
MSRILLIDDEESLREVVAFILAEAGHEVVTAGDGDEGLTRFEADLPDLVITDIRMPGAGGMEVLRRVRASGRQPPVPVIMLTAHGSVEQAVEAMRMGAWTYLLKPFERDALRLTVAQALHARELEAENRNLRDLLRHHRQEELPFLHISAPMAQVAEQVRRVAPTDASVLVSGESGTGKELVARALHELSPRWDGPFVTVNCGAIPGELMESQLFGHARGAFTGATAASPGRIRAAAGGTLFLDEIGELPLSLQPKLLRVIETRSVDPVGETRPVSVDFRLVCATNRELRADVASGRFREDLYWRLEVVQLRVPPLRERPGDIPLLWEQFTREHAQGADVRSEPELLARLRELPWPGNVRELRNLNQRMVILRRGDTLGPADLEQALSPGETVAPAARAGANGVGADGVGAASAAGALPLGPFPPGGFSLVELEKEVIRRALARCDGNKSRAAEYLGIPRHILIYRVEKYGLG